MSVNMSSMTPTAPMNPRAEMFQRGTLRDSFFNMKALQSRPRPLSDATEMFDTDFEDDESDMEDSSPRFSMNSAGRRSETTLSSFEEIHTPSPTSNTFKGFQFDLSTRKSVEGPTGPHLFRASTASSFNFQEDQYDAAESPLSPLSPVTPRPSNAQRQTYEFRRVPEIPVRHQPLGITDDNIRLDLNEIPSWTPTQVARWMYDAGFELSIAGKFEENDISGAILTTLKFEDLRELDIPSFGLRTKVWNEIHVLRGSGPSTPKPPTPIDDSEVPNTAVRGHSEYSLRQERPQECASDEEPRRHKSLRRGNRTRGADDVISPLESVSIVGIEQLMPKPHKCSKGENCSKWRKQQRMKETFKREHPVSLLGGSIWIAGNPGNPQTAEAMDDAARRFSDIVPSVVASSDVMGPGTAPSFHYLQEESLRNVLSRDPQDNVKQFIQFQGIDPQQASWSPSEEPVTPPFELFPNIQAPHLGLRNLPKLDIPAQPQVPPRASTSTGFTPYRMNRAEPISQDLCSVTRTPSTVYRFGTPFSDMDVPVTAIPLGPVSRDVSQSVPPNMSYRQGPSASTSLQRSQSRSSVRRPSFMAMPRVDENAPTAVTTPNKPRQYQTAPPRPINRHSPSYLRSSSDAKSDDVAHAGWMKKRKTKMLRHEWHEHHFTLKGTRLAMHTDARALDTLEYIDVDDYAIACTSLASGSKLDAAFKAMNISRGKEKKDEAAFAFQLIPAAIEKGLRLKKRESLMEGSGQTEGKDAGAKGKTLHFAVKSRDERIDWMRELMLAKALKQKSEGYEISVNGNMI